MPCFIDIFLKEYLQHGIALLYYLYFSLVSYWCDVVHHLVALETPMS